VAHGPSEHARANDNIPVKRCVYSTRPFAWSPSYNFVSWSPVAFSPAHEGYPERGIEGERNLEAMVVPLLSMDGVC
jgi:hypothetical protein